MEIGFNSLSNLTRIRKNVKRKRISSYDKTGANADAVLVKPYGKQEICCIEGAGAIKHIWMTLSSSDPHYLRKIILRMWWDNEESPSVECPIGDFFGVGHGKAVNFWSLPSPWDLKMEKVLTAFSQCLFRKTLELKLKMNVKRA